MKTNTKWFYTILLSFCSFFNYSQGSDIVICIDNSGSIDNLEFDDMKTSIGTIINDVLMCNPENRVSVVHYGTSFNETVGYSPKIFIESDFTNNITTAQNLTRRLSVGDYFSESTELIGDALDNIANPNIVSPQTQLNINPLNSLVIFLFTDARRGLIPTTTPTTGSFLVNSVSPGLGTNAAFQVFTNFKNNRGATFVVVHSPPSPGSSASAAAAPAAAASIASFGGTYNGSVEGYAADPDNNQRPRFYLNTTGFLLSTPEITSITEDLCSITAPVTDPCDVTDLNVEVSNNNLQWSSIATSYDLEFYSDGDCLGDAGTLLTAEYSTTNTTFSLNQVQNALMTKGFRYRIRTDCSDWSDWCCLDFTTNDTYILTDNCLPSNPCDNYDNIIITDDILTGTTIEYLTYFDIEATNTIQIGATSNYIASNSISLQPGFHTSSGSLFHAFIDCISVPLLTNNSIIYSNQADNSLNVQRLTNENMIKLFPNPTNGKVTIESSEAILQWELSNQFGKTINKDILNSNSSKKAELNLSNSPTGLYFIKITLNSGEQIIKRVVKN